MRFRLWILTAVLATSSMSADAEVRDFRSKMEKWVETQQIISQERSDWDVERELLTTTKRLMSQRRDALREEIEALKNDSVAADDERSQLLLRRGEIQRTNEMLTHRVREMEEDVLRIAPNLPKPLQKKLSPLIVQIPQQAEGIDLPLGQRLMNVLGVLAQTEKFNGTATLVGETRQQEGAEGQKVAVRTLYWGLAEAIYAGARGQIAGVGRPAAEGWVFEGNPDIAEDATLLLDIYEGNTDVVDFVMLPVEVQ